MRLCDIADIKSAFMKKTDLSEEEIQTIIDDISTAFDGDKVIEQLKEYGACKDRCSNNSYGVGFRHHDLYYKKNKLRKNVKNT